MKVILILSAITSKVV